MQYGNPYFSQPFQQIQPYQDRLAQLQNSYQQAMPYGQAQIQQPIQQMPQVPQSLLRTGNSMWCQNKNKIRNQSSHKCNWWSIQDVRKSGL